MNNVHQIEQLGFDVDVMVKSYFDSLCFSYQIGIEQLRPMVTPIQLYQKGEIGAESVFEIRYDVTIDFLNYDLKELLDIKVVKKDR